MPIYQSGTIINNRYEVVQGPNEKPSLAGGMGLVYLCVDHAEDGKPVALKTFRPELLSDRSARDRFLREGAIWTELGYHPNIVKCQQIFKIDTSSEVFFVLELIAAREGKSDASLRSCLIHDELFSVEQTLRFASNIVRAMKHATSKITGLVHRDLKPENILVGPDGVAKVTDFGLVNIYQQLDDTILEKSQKIIRAVHLNRTQLTFGIVGTPLYMAPEQWEEDSQDEQCDIYAFGCILFEMLTGTFAAEGNNIDELKQYHVSGRVSQKPLPKALSKEVVNLIRQCTSLKKSSRFKNWKEVETSIVETFRILTGNDMLYVELPLTENRYFRLSEGWSYNAIGLSYMDIGKFKIAKQYFEKVLSIGNSENEPLMIAFGLGNIGTVISQMGEPSRAIEFHEQRLAIARKIENTFVEANALGSLGTAYFQLGNYRDAQELYEQQLNLTHRNRDRHGMGNALCNLGNVFLELRDMDRALDFYQKYLENSKKISDQFGIMRALGNIGYVYFSMGYIDESIQYHLQSLTLSKKIGERYTEGKTSGNLGLAYRSLGMLNHNKDSFQRSRNYFEQALAIACEIGDKILESSWLANLANIHVLLGEYQKSIEYGEKQLKLDRSLNSQKGEAMALLNLGAAYSGLGDFNNSLKLYKQCLLISENINDPMMIGQAHLSSAMLLVQKKQLNEARHHAEKANQIFCSLQHSSLINQSQNILNYILRNSI